jgi:hypothetical protein
VDPALISLTAHTSSAEVAADATIFSSFTPGKPEYFVHDDQLPPVCS